jgi:hypothetical protein
VEQARQEMRDERAGAVRIMREARGAAPLETDEHRDYVDAWRREAIKSGELETGSPNLHLKAAKAASRCPYCLEDDFDTDPALRCPSCEAWCHVGCWEESDQKCPACRKERTSA